MQKPLEAHWNAALRVVHFLKGCSEQGILLRANSDLQLSVYVDADWSTCPESRQIPQCLYSTPWRFAD